MLSAQGQFARLSPGSHKPRPLPAAPGAPRPPGGTTQRARSREGEARRGGWESGPSGRGPPQARPAACPSARQSQSAGPAGARLTLQPRAAGTSVFLQVPRPSRLELGMATPPKRFCPSPSTSSEGTRIKKISIEGNIGKVSRCGAGAWAIRLRRSARAGAVTRLARGQRGLCEARS